MPITKPHVTQADGLTVLEGCAGEPLIVLAPIAHYSALLACPRLRGTPGAAYLFEDHTGRPAPVVYTGGTGRPAPVRISGHRLTTVARPPERIIVITRAGRPLTQPEVWALERLIWNQVLVTARAEPSNRRQPCGAALGLEEYRALQAFAATALSWLQPSCPWLAPVLQPPFCLEAPGVNAYLTGERLVLRRPGLCATLALVEGGCVVLPDSQLRRRVVPSAPVIAAVLREELAAWGALAEDGSPSLWRLTRSVWRPSLSAASLFILGAKGGGARAWLQDDPTGDLPDFPVYNNVIPFRPRLEVTR